MNPTFDVDGGNCLCELRFDRPGDVLRQSPQQLDSFDAAINVILENEVARPICSTADFQFTGAEKAVDADGVGEVIRTKWGGAKADCRSPNDSTLRRRRRDT